MIQANPEVATLGVVALTLVVAGWGIITSVGSAMRGPQWGVRFLRASRPGWVVMLIAGVVSLILVEPRWLGFVMVYLAAAAWWLGAIVARRTDRLLKIAGDAPIRPVSQASVLRWAGYGLGFLAVIVGAGSRLVWVRLPVLAGATLLFALTAFGAGIVLLLRAQKLAETVGADDFGNLN